MDVYRTLNLAVPQLLFTVLHQAGPTVSEEEFIRTVTALHLDIRHQAQEIGEELLVNVWSPKPLECLSSKIRPVLQRMLG